MKMRSRIQENRYGQALGYAWGVKDYADNITDLVLDSGAFAAWWSVLEEETGERLTIQDAYKRFRGMRTEEQRNYAQMWMRSPWSMYEEMQRMNANG